MDGELSVQPSLPIVAWFGTKAASVATHSMRYTTSIGRASEYPSIRNNALQYDPMIQTTVSRCYARSDDDALEISRDPRKVSSYKKTLQSLQGDYRQAVEREEREGLLGSAEAGVSGAGLILSARARSLGHRWPVQVCCLRGSCSTSGQA